MSVRFKRVPRLWCARLGLLPFDVVLPSEMASSAHPDTPSPVFEPLANDIPMHPCRPGEERDPTAAGDTAVADSPGEMP